MDGDIETRVRTLWKEAFNERKLDALDAITAPGFLNHNALPGTPRGPEGHRHVVERLWKAFPDAHFEIEHLASNGDTVICVGRMSGTHRGTLLAPGHRQEGGVALSATYTGGSDGPRTSWLTDPAGYRIELVQWPPGHPSGITAADFD